jgi:hypothetical protein
MNSLLDRLVHERRPSESQDLRASNNPHHVSLCLLVWEKFDIPSILGASKATPIEQLTSQHFHLPGKPLFQRLALRRRVPPSLWTKGIVLS